MTVKLDGRTFKAWLNSDWGHPDAYWKEEEVWVNDDLLDDECFDYDTIPDNARVELRGGTIYPDRSGEAEPKCAKRALRAWLKAQKTQALLVTVDKTRLGAFKAMVREFAGASLQ